MRFQIAQPHSLVRPWQTTICDPNCSWLMTTPWTPLPTRPAPRNRLIEPEPKHKSNPSHTPKPLTLDS